MNKILYAGAAALLLTLASCSGSGNSEIKKATAGFDFGYLPVMNGSTAAYVNEEGESIYEHELKAPGVGVKYMGLFHEGYAVVIFEDTQGIINQAGEMVVDLTGYDLRSRPFRRPFYNVSEKRFLANREDGDSYVCFDMEGNVLFENEGCIQTQFRGGLAMYTVKRYDDYKAGLIDTDGNVVYEAGQDEYIPTNYLENMSSPASYAHPAWFPIYTSEGYGYILDTATGKQYLEGITSPRDAFAKVDCNDRAVIYENDKYGLVDLEGNIVVEPLYDEIVNDGQWYIVKEDGLYGWIDKDGNVMIEPQFEASLSAYYIIGFGDSDLSPVDSNTFIDRKGVPVIETEYHIKSNFINGRCLLDLRRDGYAWMDREGNIGEPMNLSERTVSEIQAIGKGQATQYY